MSKKTPKFIKKKVPYRIHAHPKLPIFYKALVSVAILFAVILFYFIVLVSTSPKSIKFITQKIQTNLEKNFNNQITIKESLINFTTYGSFRIAIKDMKIAYQDKQINLENIAQETTKYLNIPKIEAEFSLWDLMFLKFNPNKVKLVSPEIIIDDTKSLLDIKNNVSTDDTVNEQVMMLVNFLSTLKKTKNSIENFEIEDAKIIFQTPKINTTLIIKSSKISTKYRQEFLDIVLQSNIYFVNNDNSANIDASCRVSKADGLQCDVNILNFAPNSLVGFHPVFADLAKINGNINGAVKLIINNSQAIRKLTFDLRADRGSFDFKEIFKDKIEYRQLKASGEFDAIKKVLNLSKVNGDLISNIAYQTEIANPHLDANMSIALLNDNQVQYDFDITLENVLIDELSRFWPLTLSQSGIRDWVLKSVNKGLIPKAQAHLTIIKDSQESVLKDIQAQVNFENAQLQYHPDYPEINKIKGSAHFTKDKMNIDISEGKVLNTNITNGKVAIDDFNMPINILSIYAKTSGASADGLKHISNNLDFRDGVDKFLNGNARNEVNISIALDGDINLKKILIDIRSQIKDTKNNFMNGDIEINTRKDFNSNIFKTAFNLKDCEINNSELQFNKKKASNASLLFNIVVDDSKIVKFKNIVLSNDDIFNDKITSVHKSKKAPKANISKIEGELSFAYDPFKIINLKLKNRNFIPNNFTLNYDYDQVKSLANLSFTGQYLNISKYLDFKSQGSSFQLPANYKLNIAVDNLQLYNNKQFRRFKLNANCSNLICKSGNVSANYNKTKDAPRNLNLKIQKFVEDNDPPQYKIEGNISDIGYVAESLNISNIIAGGDIKLSVKQNIVDKKLVLQGNLKTTSDITIFESETVKKLAKNDIFSTVQDKIFSDDKTTFGSVIIDFNLAGSELEINSLIANNFKIGITAKGKINLSNNAVAIKGMIVPGYIINSLFGLGKIPLIGSVVRGVLTGGEGGGLFSVRYEYLREAGAKEGKFSANKSTAFMPSSISGLFE